MLTRIVKTKGSYELPRKNILVLACIDLRLTDETINFLHQDNLHNRFDYFTLAGSSLCTCIDKDNKIDFKDEILKRYENFTHWEKTFTEHVELAISLHDIHDVYIIEHRDCGAYRGFLKNGNFGPGQEQQEFDTHQRFAKLLANRLEGMKLNNPKDQPYPKLKVRAFLIDLRGDLEVL
ncbi:MAG: hypothetical protein EOO09_17350 [Chitinophagaceae bacterium]|nr:MAG: hypothetical protein EOO09_17350 [Chitinophagaceae bacterium]